MPSSTYIIVSPQSAAKHSEATTATSTYFCRLSARIGRLAELGLMAPGDAAPVEWRPNEREESELRVEATQFLQGFLGERHYPSVAPLRLMEAASDACFAAFESGYTEQ